MSDYGGVWKAGAYVRLSDKTDADESESIQNQKQLLLDLIQADPTLTLYDFYTDDGLTGTNSSRDEFQRMMKDIEAGRINCVIIKDASRLGRNYIDTGSFMEYIVPKYRLRFISLMNPTIDSLKDPRRMSSIELPIINLFNEEHSKATSFKIRDVFDMKRRHGAFIGSFAAHGYMKDPQDKNRLIIDEVAANDIRMIFDLYTNEGYSKREICSYFNELGIPSPSEYKRSKGLKFQPQTAGSHRATLWNPRYIGSVLRNQMYIGNMVQGRQRTISYKVRETVQTRPEEWYIVEGTHQPIIDRALWERTQEVLDGVSRRYQKSVTSKETHLYAGLLRCADCGKAMRRNTQKRNYGKRQYTTYRCRTHTDEHNAACTPHKIKKGDLDEAVLAAIQAQVWLVLDSPLLDSFRKHGSIMELNRDLLVELVQTVYVEEGGGLRIRFRFGDQLKLIAEC